MKLFTVVFAVLLVALTAFHVARFEALPKVVELDPMVITAIDCRDTNDCIPDIAENSH